MRSFHIMARNLRALCAAIIGLSLLGSTVAAQSVWFPTEETFLFRVEAVKPNLDEYDVTTASSAYFVNGRWGVYEGWNLLLEVPFAAGKLTAPSEFEPTDSQGTIGNVYLAVERRLGSAPVFLEIGGRLPLVDESEEIACLLGLAADLNRWEAFEPDLLPFSALVAYRTHFDNGLLLFVKGGPSLWAPIGDRADAGVDTELLALAEAQAGYAKGMFGLTAGVASRYLLTEGSEYDFGERSWFQLGANGWVELGRFRPALQFRLPLDTEMRDVVNTVFSLSFDVRVF